MSDIQSLANQLSWCMVTKNYLNELNGEITFVSQKYADGMDILEQNYVAELLPEIRRMKEEFEDMTRELISHIENEHLEYVDKQSQGVQRVLGEL